MVRSLSLSLALLNRHPLSNIEAAFVSRLITLRVVDGDSGLLTLDEVVLPFHYSWTAWVKLDYQNTIGSSQMMAANKPKFFTA